MLCLRLQNLSEPTVAIFSFGSFDDRGLFWTTQFVIFNERGGDVALLSLLLSPPTPAANETGASLDFAVLEFDFFL